MSNNSPLPAFFDAFFLTLMALKCSRELVTEEMKTNCVAIKFLRAYGTADKIGENRLNICFGERQVFSRAPFYP